MHSHAGAPVQSTPHEDAGSASAAEPALTVGSSTIEPVAAAPTAKGKSAVHSYYSLDGSLYYYDWW